jgi:hypothetical protein
MFYNSATRYITRTRATPLHPVFFRAVLMLSADADLGGDGAKLSLMNIHFKNEVSNVTC